MIFRNDRTSTRTEPDDALPFGHLSKLDLSVLGAVLQRRVEVSPSYTKHWSFLTVR